MWFYSHTEIIKSTGTCNDPKSKVWDSGSRKLYLRAVVGTLHRDPRWQQPCDETCGEHHPGICLSDDFRRFLHSVEGRKRAKRWVADCAPKHEFSFREVIDQCLALLSSPSSPSAYPSGKRKHLAGLSEPFKLLRRFCCLQVHPTDFSATHVHGPHTQHLWRSDSGPGCYVHQQLSSQRFLHQYGCLWWDFKSKWQICLWIFTWTFFFFFSLGVVMVLITVMSFIHLITSCLKTERKPAALKFNFDLHT